MATLTLKKKDGSEVEVQAAVVQAPAGAHGSFAINGIPVFSPQVDLSPSINPATGGAYVQVGPRPATQISPPPSRRFDGR